jgi:hypothetical protein
MDSERVYKMSFSKVYPALVVRAERKGRSKEEVDTIIYWLTGYDEQGLQSQLEKATDHTTFYDEPRKDRHIFFHRIMRDFMN